MGGEREETVQEEPTRRRRSRAGDTVQSGHAGKEDPAGGGIGLAREEADESGEMIQDGPEDSGGASPAQRLIWAVSAAVAATEGEPTPDGLGGQAVRMHESGGQIHFHVKDGDLKCAVPIADVWSGWGKVQHIDSWRYRDVVNDTLVTIVTRLEPGDVLEAYVNVVSLRVRYGGTYLKIDNTIGRRKP